MCLQPILEFVVKFVETAWRLIELERINQRLRNEVESLVAQRARLQRNYDRNTADLNAVNGAPKNETMEQEHRLQSGSNSEQQQQPAEAGEAEAEAEAQSSETSGAIGQDLEN